MEVEETLLFWLQEMLLGVLVDINNKIILLNVV